MKSKTNHRGRAPQREHSGSAAGKADTSVWARAARRLEPPSWKDMRLIVGVLLVILSVIGGMRLVSSLNHAVPVYAAARDLLPGQAITEADLVVVQVQLGESLQRYIDGSTPLAAGTHLTRQLNAGELVPGDALGSSRVALDKSVSVPVSSTAIASLSVGEVVDVWISPRDRETIGESYADPVLLLDGAIIDQVPTQNSGLGGMGSGRSAVHLVVPADRVADLIGAIDQGAAITLVPAPRTSGGGMP